MIPINFWKEKFSTIIGFWGLTGRKFLFFSIIFKSSEGRLIYITSVSSFFFLFSVVLGSFQTFSGRVVDGSSPNLACGLVLPPYWTLFTAVPVGCTGVTHHWLWWLKTLETEVSAAFLTELLMDDHQTWHVGWYYHPTEPY